MRHARLLLLSLSVASQALAADAGGGKPPFQVVAITAEHPADKTEYKFPNFKGNEPAATTINTWLQATELHKLPGRYQKFAFEDVWPGAGSYTGITELDFTVGEINARYASVALSGEYTAAYPSSIARQYTFDSVSGQPIALFDLFSAPGIKHLRSLVSTKRVTTVRAYIKDLEAAKDDDSSERASFYNDCLPQIREDDLSLNDFELKAGTLTLSRGDCGPHATLALEDLGAIPVTLKAGDFTADLSDYGRCLLLAPAPTTACSKPLETRFVPAVYRGTVGKTPITLVIDWNEVNVGYFYDKYAKWIDLALDRRPAGAYWLREGAEDTGDGKPSPDGRFSLHGDASGHFIGQWSSSGSNKVLPVDLAPFGPAFRR